MSEQLRDQFMVVVDVDAAEYREATGLIRFDQDPGERFFELMDSKVGSLTDEIGQAVRQVLERAQSGVAWKITVRPFSTPMTTRGRHERVRNGKPVANGRRSANSK